MFTIGIWAWAAGWIVCYVFYWLFDLGFGPLFHFDLFQLSHSLPAPLANGLLIVMFILVPITLWPIGYFLGLILGVTGNKLLIYIARIIGISIGLLWLYGLYLRFSGHIS